AKRNLEQTVIEGSALVTPSPLWGSLRNPDLALWRPWRWILGRRSGVSQLCMRGMRHCASGELEGAFHVVGGRGDEEMALVLDEAAVADTGQAKPSLEGCEDALHLGADGRDEGIVALLPRRERRAAAPALVHDTGLDAGRLEPIGAGALGIGLVGINGLLVAADQPIGGGRGGESGRG